MMIVEGDTGLEYDRSLVEKYFQLFRIEEV